MYKPQSRLNFFLKSIGIFRYNLIKLSDKINNADFDIMTITVTVRRAEVVIKIRKRRTRVVYALVQC